MIYDNRQFYIDGAWVDPVEPKEFSVINPATEAVAGCISMGGPKDVQRAVAAARRAFDGYSHTTRAERLALLERVLAAYMAHYDEIALAICTEMGAPINLARGPQTSSVVDHIGAMIELLQTFKFEDLQGTTRLLQEPVGVCALITPCNWPMNQVAAKVVPALAAGCTMILKPSEYSPFSAMLWAKVLHEAAVPPGVFNLINGDGNLVGAALCAHPDVDMVSFTGSTLAGIEVARITAVSVKRVHQELSGNSPAVLLEDADFENAVTHSVLQVLQNSGQSSNAPTLMLVPEFAMANVAAIAKRVAEGVVMGDPSSQETALGPVGSKGQFDRVEALIEKGMTEGANLVTGGAGRPAGLNKGYFVKPTIFSDVGNKMTIAREEIFGPVLCILPYRTEDEAIALANDAPYRLAAYVWSKDIARANQVARRIRAGQVALNGAKSDMRTPFSGFNMSGNGREYGEFGLRAFLELKAIAAVPQRSIDLSKSKTRWPLRYKLRRGIWTYLIEPLVRWLPKVCSPLRVMALRAMGANIGPHCMLLPGLRVLAPWNLRLHEYVVIGEHVNLYNFAPIDIGRMTMVSQNTYLCTGSHDYNKSHMPLTYAPIQIGEQVWIASGVYVAPGVCIADGAVVGARSVVTRSLVDPWTVWAGNPCRRIKAREFPAET